ncbi:hypothetical protein HPB47_000028, partial [Ixodes persulcatus]
KERPVQCRKCCGYVHREATCNSASVCNHCRGTHEGDMCSAQEKCVNCGGAHAATSPSCQKWKKENEARNYAQTHAIDYRAAQTTIHRPKRAREVTVIIQP